MAQQSDNPAQGLIDLYRRVTGKEEKKPAPAKVDTSWHDEQVKRANESFQKQQVGKKPVPAAVKKRTAPLANKRTPRKRSK